MSLLAALVLAAATARVESVSLTTLDSRLAVRVQVSGTPGLVAVHREGEVARVSIMDADLGLRFAGARRFSWTPSDGFDPALLAATPAKLDRLEIAASASEVSVLLHVPPEVSVDVRRDSRGLLLVFRDAGAPTEPVRVARATPVPEAAVAPVPAAAPPVAEPAVVVPPPVVSEPSPVAPPRVEPAPPAPVEPLAAAPAVAEAAPPRRRRRQPLRPTRPTSRGASLPRRRARRRAKPRPRRQGPWPTCTRASSRPPRPRRRRRRRCRRPRSSSRGRTRAWRSARSACARRSTRAT